MTRTRRVRKIYLHFQKTPDSIEVDIKSQRGPRTGPFHFHGGQMSAPRKIRRAVVPARHVWLVEGTGCIFDTKERAERFVAWIEKKEAERRDAEPDQWVEVKLPRQADPERPDVVYDTALPDHWDA